MTDYGFANGDLISKRDSKKKATIAGTGAVGVGALTYPVKTKVTSAENYEAGKSIKTSPNGTTTMKVKDLQQARIGAGKRPDNERNISRMAQKLGNGTASGGLSEPITVVRYRDNSIHMKDGHHRHEAAGRAFGPEHEMRVNVINSKKKTATRHAAWPVRRMMDGALEKERSKTPAQWSKESLAESASKEAEKSYGKANGTIGSIARTTESVTQTPKIQTAINRIGAKGLIAGGAGVLAYTNRDRLGFEHDKKKKRAV